MVFYFFLTLFIYVNIEELGIGARIKSLLGMRHRVVKDFIVNKMI